MVSEPGDGDTSSADFSVDATSNSSSRSSFSRDDDEKQPSSALHDESSTGAGLSVRGDDEV